MLDFIMFENPYHKKYRFVFLITSYCQKNVKITYKIFDHFCVNIILIDIINIYLKRGSLGVPFAFAFNFIFEALIGHLRDIRCFYWSNAGQTRARKKRPSYTNR